MVVLAQLVDQMVIPANVHLVTPEANVRIVSIYLFWFC